MNYKRVIKDIADHALGAEYQAFAVNPSADNWKKMIRAMLVYQLARQMSAETADSLADTPLSLVPDAILTLNNVKTIETVID